MYRKPSKSTYFTYVTIRFRYLPIGLWLQQCALDYLKLDASVNVNLSSFIYQSHSFFFLYLNKFSTCSWPLPTYISLLSSLIVFLFVVFISSIDKYSSMWLIHIFILEWLDGGVRCQTYFSLQQIFSIFQQGGRIPKMASDCFSFFWEKNFPFCLTFFG